MESVVPAGMEESFAAAKAAKTLTVHAINDVGCGWLAVRLLGDWLRRCNLDEGGTSDIGIVIYSLKHGFDYYADHLVQFGIDLKRHEAKGHLRFMGNQFKQLVTDHSTTPPTPPALTFEASLELLMDEAHELRAHYKRTVLLMDNPEVAMSLFPGDDEARIASWLVSVDGAAYQFHNAIISMVIRFPDVTNSDSYSYATANAAATAICTIDANSDMAITVRGSDKRSSGKDGVVSVTYRMDYESTDGTEVDDESHTVKVQPNGRSIEIMDSFY